MSALSRHLDDYLWLRRVLGHDLADAARFLPRFVDHLEAHGMEFMTITAALAWSLEPVTPAASTVPGRRMMAVRGFARYLAGIDASHRPGWSGSRGAGGRRSSTPTPT